MTAIDLYAFDDICEVIAIVQEVGDYIDETADLVEEVEYRQVARGEWIESERYGYLDYDHTDAAREFDQLPEVTLHHGDLDNTYLIVEVGDAKAKIDLTYHPRARISFAGERVTRHCYASHSPADLDDRVQEYCQQRAREVMQLPDIDGDAADQAGECDD